MHDATAKLTSGKKAVKIKTRLQYSCSASEEPIVQGPATLPRAESALQADMYTAMAVSINNHIDFNTSGQ